MWTFRPRKCVGQLQSGALPLSVHNRVSVSKTKQPVAHTNTASEYSSIWWISCPITEESCTLCDLAWRVTFRRLPLLKQKIIVSPCARSANEDRRTLTVINDPHIQTLTRNRATVQTRRAENTFTGHRAFPIATLMRPTRHRSCCARRASPTSCLSC